MIDGRLDFGSTEKRGRKDQGDRKKEFVRAHIILDIRDLSNHITLPVLVGNRKIGSGG